MFCEQIVSVDLFYFVIIFKLFFKTNVCEFYVYKDVDNVLQVMLFVVYICCIINIYKVKVVIKYCHTKWYVYKQLVRTETLPFVCSGKPGLFSQLSNEPKILHIRHVSDPRQTKQTAWLTYFKCIFCQNKRVKFEMGSMCFQR